MARKKQTCPELKLYQLDTMIYVSSKNILEKLTMFNEFVRAGGVKVAIDNSINVAQALERFGKNYNVDDITRLTNEKGQANDTWLRKAGLIISDNGKYEPSIIAKSLLKGNLPISEYCFLLLSKQWIKVKTISPSQEYYHRNLLAMIFEDLLENKLINIDDFNNHINNCALAKYKATYIDLEVSNQDGPRYLLEPLLASKIIYIDDDKYVFNDAYHDLAIDYLNSESKIRKIDQVTCSEEVYSNSFEYGVYDVFTDDNKAIYQNLCPSLIKLQGHKIGNTYSPLTDEKGNILPIQLVLFGAPGTGKSHFFESVLSNGECVYSKVSLMSEFEKYLKSKGSSDGTCKNYTSFLFTELQSNLYTELLGHKCNSVLDCVSSEEVKILYDAFCKGGVLSALNCNSVPSAALNNYLQFFCDYSISHKKDAYNIPIVFRTTFHPDYDYSSFVGCYKPTKIGDKISYSYTPQVFIKAYTSAWKNPSKPVVLIIEEINRGNCAQIFGDLFQLLDRNKNEVSAYDIHPDYDLENYLFEDKVYGFADSVDVPKVIKSGSVLRLPSNLYIWATMNTSDQSLFPIDSAFKRRWDWKYVKISNAYEREVDGSFKTDVNGDKIPLGWRIEDNNNTLWWEFLKQVNKLINKMTLSADKQLGYFFCKADERKIITLEKFVNKVLFYLWNDVFKDYAMDEGNLFKYKIQGTDEEIDLTYPDFYNEDGEIEKYVVEQFIDKVMKWNYSSK